MTATLYPFIPSNTGTPPSFQPTFDGNQYTVTVVWGLFGQRYYIKCVDMNGNTIYQQPLIESLPGVQLSTLAWNEVTQFVYGTTANPHGYQLGATISLTVAGATPSKYNGTWLVLITGASSFSYPGAFTSDPGPTSVAGTLAYVVNMNAAWFGTVLAYVNGNFAVGA
jgi:hypothetical protein